MRRRAAVDRLVRAVTHIPGDTSPAQRESIARGDPVAGTLGEYTTKVRTASFRITDTDITGLRDAGLTDDAIFEATLAAAVGAAAAILDRGLDALPGA